MMFPASSRFMSGGPITLKAALMSPKGEWDEKRNFSDTLQFYVDQCSTMAFVVMLITSCNYGCSGIVRRMAERKFDVVGQLCVDHEVDQLS